MLNYYIVFETQDVSFHCAHWYVWNKFFFNWQSDYTKKIDLCQFRYVGGSRRTPVKKLLSNLLEST